MIHALSRIMPALLILSVVAAPAAALEGSIGVSGPRGGGTLRLIVSQDWSRPLPDVTRAVITIHGQNRDVLATDRVAEAGLAAASARPGSPPAADTLLITPDFPRDTDPVGADDLRWHRNDWMDGQDADAPAPIGSFTLMDAIIARLSDRNRFPRLVTIVLVGHSGGGQFVQRYAVLAHAAPAGTRLRFVIANASSYAYFSPDRPAADGGFSPYPAGACPGFDRWKYGLQDLPIDPGAASAGGLEARYVGREVTYLLGTRDTDPDLGALDKSCAAEAQGPDHVDRGRAYFRYLQLRHPSDLRQQLHEVPGIGHDQAAMLTSAEALAAIYDPARPEIQIIGNDHDNLR
ncbi:hypothetical protein [Lichenicola sp.]|uniref:hypothetical protein n=1 Tax=Lichenicola sp. TaxID=2804529 RepID=UPI003AFF8F7E